jgi:hypothetical protein
LIGAECKVIFSIGFMILSVRSLTQILDRTMDHIDRHLHEVGDPKDNSDQLDAVIVTGIMVSLLVSLISLLYLAQYIVSKWWYVSRHFC